MMDSTFQKSWTPTQADVWKGDGKLMYGFSASEFAALMILGGFSPDHMGKPGIGNSVCYLGTTYLAAHDAFSQVAHFDPHAGRKKVPPKNGLHVHDVPVQGILHLALGMLKLCPKRTCRQWIIFPNPALTAGEDSNTTLSTLESKNFDYWATLPKSLQLNRISYSLEQLVLISIGAIFNYSTQSNDDLDVETNFMENIVDHSGPLPLHKALLAAYVVDALVPWALLPVAPKHLVLPLQQILSDFVASREETVEVLCHMIRSPSLSSSLKSFHDGWKDAQERVEAVERTGNMKTDYFSQSADNCKYYYDTMVAAFEDSHVSIDLVRETLAAAVAWHVLYPQSSPYWSEDEKDGKGRQRCMTAMVSHLYEGSPKSDIESTNVENLDWALKIYATYLWGWLGDSLETNGDFLGRFRRRVFLG